MGGQFIEPGETMLKVDYTKFRLKPDEEIKDALKETAGIFIISCNKCYKEFEIDVEPEYEKLLEILGDDKSKISGHAAIDFLCNSHLTVKKLSRIDIPTSTDAVGVISCGIGIQLIAEKLKGKRVLALADSVPENGKVRSGAGYHGISLGVEKCAACGQCYLNITGGICPVADCAKGLLNGPCGGAKEGKCEVNPEDDCAWEKIYLKLKEQGRSLPGEIKIRDYGKFGFDEKNSISASSRKRRLESFYGGIYPLEKKEETINLPIETFPEPERVIIFLSQHAGYPAEPLIRAGSKVKVGQKIGESKGIISIPVHSSVSGKVIAIEEKMHPSLQKLCPAVIIENDGLDSPDSSAEPVSGWEKLSKEELLELLKEKGISGLGGAMFPTHVKLSPPKPVDTLIVNGCECEPYLNADNRVMIEYSESIFKGIEAAGRILGIKNTVIGIEENKSKAIEKLKGSNSSSGITIISLKTKYPQGAERMLIKKLLDRQVPECGLPFEVGVVVLNVSTVFAIYQAVYEGMPLIRRIVTVSGEGLKRSGNFLIRIGTPFTDIVNSCFAGSMENLTAEYDLKMGGPMMGILQPDLDSGIIKGTSGVTILRKSPVEISTERECIKCGRCAEVCPMELYPMYYAHYGEKGMWEKSLEYDVENCIECGCCEYICSSKIDLLSYIKKAKEYARNKAKK